MALTAKQERFALEYTVDLNATQAARRAGYSKRTAHSSGPRLLENVGVRQEIERLKGSRAKRTQIDADRVLRELGELMDSDPREAFDDRGRLKLPKDLPLALSKMVRSFDRESGRITFADRLRLMELIGKHVSVSAFREQLIHGVHGDLAEMIRAGRERVKRSREKEAMCRTQSRKIAGDLVRRVSPKSPRRDH